MFSQEDAADLPRRTRRQAAHQQCRPLCPDPLFHAASPSSCALSRGLPVRSLGPRNTTPWGFRHLFRFLHQPSARRILGRTAHHLEPPPRTSSSCSSTDCRSACRTLAALRRFTPWGSVWGMSGNVLDVRYKLLSRRLRSLGHTTLASLNQAPRQNPRRSHLHQAELEAHPPRRIEIRRLVRRALPPNRRRKFPNSSKLSRDRSPKPPARY